VEHTNRETAVVGMDTKVEGMERMAPEVEGVERMAPEVEGMERMAPEVFRRRGMIIPGEPAENWDVSDGVSERGWSYHLGEGIERPRRPA
jgi:hypothetical protein